MIRRLFARCSCWCRCAYRAGRPWQSGQCVPCSLTIHAPKPGDPDRGEDGPRIVQARRVPPVGFP